MNDRTVTSPVIVPSGVSLLFLATVSATIGGFLRPYAEHFRALGWRVDAAAHGAGRDARLDGAFDHVYDLPLSRSILDLDGMRRGATAISKALESGPDIVHVHTPIAAFMTRFVVRTMPANRRPAVAYTAHGFHFYRGGGEVTNTVFLAAEKVAGRWTDRLVVINDEDDRAARRHHIVPPGNLVRMPGIGVDTEWYSRSSLEPGDVARVRHEMRVKPGAPLFVAVGELNRNKRMADIVEALARMRHREAVLVVAGTGAEQGRLEALAEERGVRDRVRLAGHVDDIRPVVGGATALVLASNREGLARAIMEALALEVPVIASTARGNRDLVGADSGFIFTIGDVNDLAARMDWLVDHPAEGLAMGLRGRQRIVERFDQRSLIRLHEEMYGDMLAGRAWRGI